MNILLIHTNGFNWIFNPNNSENNFGCDKKYNIIQEIKVFILFVAQNIITNTYFYELIRLHNVD